jgi:hypothetical protein
MSIDSENAVQRAQDWVDDNRSMLTVRMSSVVQALGWLVRL